MKRLFRGGPHRCFFGLMVIILFASVEGYGMKKLVLFSEIKGKVIQNGKPIQGAHVERTYKWGWNDESGTDQVTTDEAGAFAFPMIERLNLLASFLPHEPSISQKILIHHDNKTYEAWVVSKRDYENNGELNGKPVALTCRLENPPKREGPVYGICQVD